MGKQKMTPIGIACILLVLLVVAAARDRHAAVTVVRRHEVENLVLVLCARDGGGQRPHLF